MLLLIDNFDSFTYNLARYFTELGQTVEVVRNNQISLADIDAIKPRYLVLSPGPCTPNEAGITLQVVEHFAGKIPMLGVCLGHQAIAQSFGAEVVNAERIMHGKTSSVEHSGSALFRDVSSPFEATRYHSLVVKPDTLPNDFTVTAWVKASQPRLREIMAFEHKSMPLYGVQFHPESLLTTQGHKILQNFLFHKQNQTVMTVGAA
ncbi:anthranilate synthase component II [Alteromonas facilis]|uniref:anthranilate synthase component II n=1 Tax=Alteromonas facilis TaxID=2048004 RepID=UPI000C295485|nr:aminodeoxychorismate/anthranilate synthase component II [Alteromonas facilis]